MNAKFATPLFLLCSCGGLAGNALAGGPLQEDFDADGRIEMCSRSKVGERYSFGDVIENTTPSPIRVTEALFDSVKGVKVLGITRIALTDENVGTVKNYPPRNITKDRWREAEPLKGSVLLPGEQWGVVVGLQLEDVRGSARHLSIAYEMDGEEYVAQDHDSYEMRGRCK